MSGITLPPLNVPLLLKKFDLRPSKGLGQNFLIDDHALQLIVSQAHIRPDEDVLEIGPGLGNLTRYLALAAQQVTAVELDRKLLPVLKETLLPYRNVKFVQGDILKIDLGGLMDGPDYLVVANIPYYITSALLRRLLESGGHPSRLVLTIQEEVAGRICAKPGKMNLLALSVQVYGTPEVVGYIPAESFYPAPKVDSAILRVDILPHPFIPMPLLEEFFRLIKAGFSQKRKTLRNSLSGGLAISPGAAEEMLVSVGVDPIRRAETLSLEEWGKLCRMKL